MHTVVVAATTRPSTKKSGQDSSLSDNGTSPNFAVMALQTIGGSFVPSKGGSKTPMRQGDDAGVVKIERTWKVESNSRSKMFPDDGDSEELTLGSFGIAEVDPDPERQRIR